MKLLQWLGKIAFILGWPLFMIYFRHSKRTRILLIHDDKILIVKNWLSLGHWSLPGGGIKKGEDPGIGAVRELYEETAINISVADLTPIGTGHYSGYGLSFSFYAYFVRLDREVKMKRELIEVAEMKWEDIAKVRTLGTGGDTKVVLDMYDAYKSAKTGT